MATAKQPRDSAGAAIPVLRFRSGASQELTSVTSSTAQRSSAFSTGTQVITVTVTEPMYFATGDSSVTATSDSHYILANVPLDMALGTDVSSTIDYHTHISVIAVSTTGTVYISERE